MGTFCQLIIKQVPKLKTQMKVNQAGYAKQEKSSKRRMTTDCNYSVLSTLLMRFLKDKDKQAYKLSRDLAKKNKISEEKNYSIIFLRIALYLHRTACPSPQNQEVVRQLFQWLEIQVDDCVTSKYKDNIQEFKKLIKKRNREILAVIKRVFEEADLTNTDSVRHLVINIYEKKGKEYSKTHEKMALNLAKLIVGVISQGQQFQGQVKQEKRALENSGSFADSSLCACSHIPDLSSTLVGSTIKQMQWLENLCSQQELSIFTGRSNKGPLEKSTPLLDLNFFEVQNQASFMMELDSSENSFFM